MADDLQEAIRKNAEGPAKVEGDAGSVEQHPLPEQLEVHRVLRSDEATRKKDRGLRFNKFVPPGAA